MHVNFIQTSQIITESLSLFGPALPAIMQYAELETLFSILMVIYRKVTTNALMMKYLIPWEVKEATRLCHG